jgi:hypothetical protein
MWITLENRKKVAADSLRSAFMKKNKVEERGASGSRMKKEHDNTDLRAQKMMMGRVEPFVVPTMVRAMPIMV